MVHVATSLLAVVAGLCGSQAFFVAPPSSGPRVVKCGAITAAWAPRYNRRQTSSTGRAGRLAADGALRMDSLEEVPEALSDKILALECPETGNTLKCYAERFAVVDGSRYLVAYPKDPAVAIAFDENGEVAPVPIDDPLMDDLFPLAEACLADLGADVTLLRTPTTLTAEGLDDVVGPLLDETDETESNVSFEGDDEEEEGEDEDDEFFEDADEVELLGEFLLEGEEFLLVRFLEPLLVLAKETGPGHYVLLNEDEDQDANPVVEDLLSADAL